MKDTINKVNLDEATPQRYMPKRSNLYASVSRYAPDAIKRVAELLNSKNESIALGAAKVILDKCLPDVKALTLEGESNDKLQITIVEDKQEDNR